MLVDRFLTPVPLQVTSLAVFWSFTPFKAGATNMHKDQYDEHGLQRLSTSSDYQVAPDVPDVRGWNVVGRDGQRIGKVDDLLIDPARMKVAQLDVDIKGGDHINVPAEEVQIDRANREVRIEGYAPGAYRKVATSATGSSRTDERLTRTEEELRVGKRAVEAGEVVVGKHVETERKQVPVNLKREEIVIERRPVNREAGATDIRDDQVRVPLMEEEAVVDKRPVVKEELVVGKRVVEDQKTVETEVRHEEFDIDKSKANVKDRNRR
jgi:uncharacterized protein (TIGR02271 family)